MAGDWIKMRMNLRSHPKVVRISSALKADRLRVIGGLHAVWSMADEHTDDGSLPGYTLQALDETVSWPGFGQALKDVEWLEEGAQGLVLPRFDEHNGASAKRRAMESERKRRDRNLSASDADEKRTREEKRREDLGESELLREGPDQEQSQVSRKGLVTQELNETARRILEFLNLRTGHSYKPVPANVALIVSRLKEGASEADCRSVIASKVREWKNTDREIYLRPATLFAASKFAQYQGQLKDLPPEATA